ncbi:MAG: DUF2520 domain-containing protein [Rhodocyclaceae bacterium]|nr:DUF2520 domain-containing protein [Rhodocyclaceae bacterium]
MPPSLNIVGCGRVGRSLGRLWSAAGELAVAGIHGRSAASREAARAFIGGGQCCPDLASMPHAEAWLLGTPDGAIAGVAESLAASGRVRPGDIVFHCSGARSHTLLEPLACLGAEAASAHPVLSFASPEAACAAFAGSFVGIEGGAPASRWLRARFEAIGARCFAIEPEAKLLYHAGSVFASNFTVTLLDVALQAYQAAGLDHRTASALMAPLVRGAIDNALALGPAAALSGPAARGDTDTLRDQQQAVSAWQPEAGRAYEVLTRLALDLARRKTP